MTNVITTEKLNEIINYAFKTPKHPLHMMINVKDIEGLKNVEKLIHEQVNEKKKKIIAVDFKEIKKTLTFSQSMETVNIIKKLEEQLKNEDLSSSIVTFKNIPNKDYYIIPVLADLYSKKVSVIALEEGIYGLSDILLSRFSIVDIDLSENVLKDPKEKILDLRKKTEVEGSENKLKNN